jgi:hypothetical protein
MRDLLDIEYFHVVFTIPETLGPVALQNKRLLYSFLFRSVSETLLEIARDPKHLGAQIGFIGVLHTWGQNLHHHPHIHCVVPGGGLSPDQSRWISCRSGFFLPVRVLSRLFRRKFLALLRKAYEKGDLTLTGKLQGLSDPRQWKHFLQPLQQTDWVVYAKPPFGGPEQTLKYLARYTHRVAISNQRLVSIEEGKVTFRIKDYANGNRKRTMTLDAVEFIRRFLLHVLPSGFMHIRHYGFLANRIRSERLARCRQLLSRVQDSSLSSPEVSPHGHQDCQLQAPDCTATCPACKKGRMILVARINRDHQQKMLSWLVPDTS